MRRCAGPSATPPGATRIGDVRGMGLANGIEIVTDRASKAPDAAAADQERRRHGVLVGTTGRGNVLKVRPPLAFTEAEVPVFIAALVASLREVVSPLAD